MTWKYEEENNHNPTSQRESPSTFGCIFRIFLSVSLSIHVHIYIFAGFIVSHMLFFCLFLHLTITWPFAHIKYSSKTESQACLKFLANFSRLFSGKIVALCVRVVVSEGAALAVSPNLVWAPKRGGEIKSTDPKPLLSPKSQLCKSASVAPGVLPDFLVQALANFFCEGSDWDCLPGCSSWAVSRATSLEGPTFSCCRGPCKPDSQSRAGL